MTALVFLGITGVLLIWDLKHPLRFYLIFTKHHWSSWLVKGAFIIGGYGGIVVLYLAASVFDVRVGQQVLGVLGIVRGLATACYTAYLFAQAKARDLWQSPLLPAHLAVQAVLAGRGDAVAVRLAGSHRPAVCARSRWCSRSPRPSTSCSSGRRRTCRTSPPTPPSPPTRWSGADSRGSSWSASSRWRSHVAAPWIGVVAVPFALIGLLAHEHAYVQAGQSVPLA